jgi:hypothetical protein
MWNQSYTSPKLQTLAPIHLSHFQQISQTLTNRSTVGQLQGPRKGRSRIPDPSIHLRSLMINAEFKGRPSKQKAQHFILQRTLRTSAYRCGIGAAHPKIANPQPNPSLHFQQVAQTLPNRSSIGTFRGCMEGTSRIPAPSNAS